MTSGAIAWVCSLACAAPSLPAAHDESSADRVVLSPATVHGELPARWRAAIDDAVADHLARAGLVPVAVTSVCGDAECRAAQARDASAGHVVEVAITVAAGGDYDVALQAYDGRTAAALASVSGRCSLCGYEELVELSAAKAAALAQTLRQLGASDPELTFRGAPDHAELRLDGTALGEAPITMRVAPGRHTLEISKPGWLPQTIGVDAVEGVRKELSYRLVRATSSAPARTGRPAIAIGSASLGVGVGAIVAGAVLLAIDHHPYRGDCQADASGQCRYLYGTRTGGAVALALGAAMLVSGVALVAIGGRRRARARLQRRGLSIVF